MTPGIFLRDPACSDQSASISRLPYPSASPHRVNVARRDRNVDLLSISYAFRPHLRTRLTLSGLTFLRKPQTFGDTSSHRVYRYLCRQGLLCSVQQSSRSAFRLHAMLPYQSALLAQRTFRSFGRMLEPRWIVGAYPLDQ